MAREIFEFYCGHCPANPIDPKAMPGTPTPKRGAFFFVSWDMERAGQFLFVCPNCQREHARCISAGEKKSNDTEVRFVGGEPGWERIFIHKSAWHRKQMLKLQ